MNVGTFFFLIIGCSGSTHDPPTIPNADAEILIAADLDGNGKDEIIAIEGGKIFWNQEQYPLTGSIQTYRVGPSGKGKKEIVLLATGRSRSSPRAKPTIIQIEEAVATPLYIGDRISERISDLRITPNGVFVTRIQEGKLAEGAWLVEGSFTSETKSIMGLQQIPLGGDRFAIGRLYGDKPKEFGGLEIHEKGEKAASLPVLRGVRTLDTTDLDNDGHQDLIVADGWHYRYGEEARARLLAFMGPDFTDRRLITELDGSYTINRIEIIAIEPAKPPNILVHASHGTFMLHPATISWQVQPLAVPKADKTILPVKHGSQMWLFGSEGNVNSLHR